MDHQGLHGKILINPSSILWRMEGGGGAVKSLKIRVRSELQKELRQAFPAIVAQISQKKKKPKRSAGG